MIPLIKLRYVGVAASDAQAAVLKLRKAGKPLRGIADEASFGYCSSGKHGFQSV